MLLVMLFVMLLYLLSMCIGRIWLSYDMLVILVLLLVVVLIMFIMCVLC